MTPKRIAAALVAAGTFTIAAGVAMVFVPAGIVVGGIGLVAIGLLGIDVSGKK